MRNSTNLNLKKLASNASAVKFNNNFFPQLDIKKTAAALLSAGVCITSFQVGTAHAAIAISDSGIAASSPPQTRPGSSGGGGASTSNTGIAMVGDGDCSIFAGDTVYSGVYGTDASTYLGGMYGFGSQSVSRDYADPSNAAANSGIISYQSAEQSFGNVTFHGYANSAQVNNKTTAYGVNSFAVGCNSKALGVSSTAIGMNVQANGTASIAMGQSSIANAGGTIALGLSAQALDTDALALGTLSYASVKNAIAIGSNAQATGIGATALGSTANGSSDAGVIASGAGAVALGGNATKGSSATGDDAIAIAGESSATATSAIAIGRGSAASKNLSIAIGDGTQSTIVGGVALGANSIASVDAGVSGFDPFSNAASTTTGGTWVSTTGSVSVGSGSTITRQITGLAAGTNDTDAVNIAQLKQMRAYAAQGWNISVGGGEASNVGLGSQVDFSAGNSGNLLVTKGTDNNNISFELAENISVSSVKAGNSLLNTNGLAITVGDGSTALSATGLTIANGPSVTTSGINAASKKVTNLADATLSETSTDAVTGKQLNETNTNLATTNTNLDTTNANLATTNSNVTALNSKVNDHATNINAALGSGDITDGTAPSFSIQGVVKDSVAAALTAADTAITTNKDNIATNTTNIATNSTDIASLQANALQYSGGVFTATRNGSSQKITGVANGTADSDAVNYGQLSDAISGASWSLSVGGENSTKIGNGATVDFSAGSSGNLLVTKGTDNNNISFELAKNIDVTSVTAGNSLLNTNGLAITVGDGSTALTATGLTIANGPSVTTSGINAASKKVTNLADATLSETSTDAVTGKQLNETNTNLATTNTNLDTTNANLATTNSNVTALNSKVNDHATNINAALGSGDITDGTAPSFSIQGVVKDSVAAALTAADTAITTNKDNIATNTTNIATNSTDIASLQANALQYSGGVFTATRNGSSQKITGVANGTADSDAVNYGQLSDAISGASWSLSVGGENSTKIGNGATVDFSAGSSGNLLVTKGTDNNNISFELAKNIDVTSVTAGNSLLNTNGLAITVGDGSTALTATGLTIANGPSVTTSGINAASKKVTNLADATLSETSTDAVTGKQLNETNTNLATTNTNLDTTNANLATTNSNVTALNSKVNDHATNINAALGSGDITDGTAPSFSIQGVVKDSVAAALTAADTAITTNKDNIATNTTNIATNSTDIASLQANALQYSGGVFTATRNGSSQKITGVANGTADSDAVNYGQLSDAISGASWSLSVGGENSTKIGNGATVDFSAGSSGNLLVTKGTDNNNISFELAKNIDVTSVTAGNSLLNTNGLAITVGDGSTALTATGLTIANGPSVTTSGINAASKKVTNLADATLSETSTDAVTGKQLNETNTNLATTNTNLDTTNANLATTNSNVTALNSKVNDHATNINAALGSGDITDGTAPSFSIQGVVKDSVAAALTAADTAITTNKDNIATNTTNIATNSTDIASLQANALQYSGGVFTATRNGSSQKITGVANGTADSDAVNYGQLSDAISGASWSLSVGGENSTKIGNGATVDFSAGSSGNLLVTKGTDNNNISFELAENIDVTSVTAGNSLLNTNGLAITVGDGSTALSATGLTIANGPSVTTLGINAASKKVTNLADATLSETSTDAVTGKQLNETNTNLATTNTNLDTTNANLATTNSNVTALNSKVNDHATNINAALGSGDITDGTAPSFSIQGTAYDNVSSAFSGVDTSLNAIKGQINSIDTDALKWDTTINSFNASRINDNGESTASKITNVAAGDISANSTDVINGSQLYSTNESINSVANLTSSALGGGADLANGVLPSFQISTIVANDARMLRSGSLVSTYDSVDSALTQLDTNINVVNDKVEAVSSNVSNLSSNALLWDDTAGAFNAGRTVDGEVTKSKITNVADGSLEENSSDAVNGGQLYSSNSQIASFLGAGAAFINGTWTAPNFVISQIDTSGNKTSANYGNVGDALTGVSSSIDNVNQRVSDVQSQIDNMGPDEDALRYDESAGGYDAGSKNNQPNKIVNVENGTIAQNSKDAVNGGQLWDTNQRIDQIQSNVNDVATNAVTYDKDENGNKTNSISLKGADASKPVVINNVADGKIEKDSKQAVNGGQLYDYTKEQMQVTLNDSKAYTDQRIESMTQNSVEQANYYTDAKFNQLNGSINDVRKEARQAAAIGLAASSLRFDSTPGKISIAAGGGFWKSEGAFAVGAGYTSETGKVRANVTATSAGGDFGVGAGVSFTLN
ncbi:YadA-like family protein [Bartonella sp. HY329]|uniref:YadA-like family protein n=1 Tax=unclassified Bartonella TaxID=2645622 RepID=UPI0021C91312|nr:MULTISPECIES: YadA-like family protein [unclassified Bartonella]UXM94714.1 YadA-like family protein [Bartonella sp. HY329]UXN09037.1 YadA-like family protein [Bartonella sp. HY328]